MKILYSPRDTPFVMTDPVNAEEYWLYPGADTPVPDHLADLVKDPISSYARIGITVMTGDNEVDRGLRATADSRFRLRQRAPNPAMSPTEIEELD